MYVVFVLRDKASYLDGYGRPLRSTEARLFGLPLFAVVLGLLELMMRERARIDRPGYFRLIGPRDAIRKQ